MLKFALKLCCIVLIVVGLTSCSSSKKVTTTEEIIPATHETSVDGAAADSDTGRPVQRQATKKVTTVEETDEGSDCGGVLSCTFEVVGDIIALPFRAIAGLIQFIF
jgi:hypothetical protein